MHGYELRKRLNLMLGWGRVLSYGSLYPTLKKMLRGSLIEETATSVMTVTRRPRIVYQVTEAGTREFERLMSEVGPTAWEDDNFDIRFAFFGRTDMEIRLRVLEGRRTRLQERLDRVQNQLAMTQKEVDRYAAELQAALVGTGGPADRHLLDEAASAFEQLGAVRTLDAARGAA